MIEAWVWTGTALVGLVLSAYMLREAGLDAWAIRGITNGRRMLARGHVRRELFRFGLQALWLAIGLAAVLELETPLVIIGLLATPAIVAANTALDIWQRHQEARTFGPNR